ncbi:MAG: helix-turn-helix domain-containing protein [Pseudomonadota bacterium]|nr:helix-turn-helix domain-containing protein [Pseudomonadota bacterium]
MDQQVDPVRGRILREATRLFAAQGYAGTPIQAVAEAAGVTKPTLVYHFGSKEGLRDAVLTGVLDHWQAELPRLLAAATKSGPRIDALLAALFAFFRSEPALARLVLREMLDRPDDMGARLRRQLQPWTALLAEAVRLGQGGGLLRAEADPEAFVVLVISAAIGVVAIGDHAGALVSPEPSVDAQVGELVRIARTALLAPREG